MFLLLVSSTVHAQFQVAKFFSSNMVLQRDVPVPVWGKAVPGNKIEVRFGAFKQITRAGKDSAWKIFLPKQPANHHPQSLFISSGDAAVQYNNILIGDIWICSGQSNMEWAMSKEMHWKQESVQSNQPLIRFINPPPAGRYVYGIAYTDSLNRRLTKDSFYLWDGWQVCDSATIKPMSAVGYYFAKSIVANKNIPIGLINLSIGGAPLETFISRDVLQNSKQFAVKAKGNWLTNESLPDWVRERGNQNVGNNPNGYGDDLGLNHAYKPGFAFECGVAPILPLPVKGVIWYQGESNSLEKNRVEEYKDLLHLLINDYRQKWKQPAMPFYWVQLSSIDTFAYKSHFWPQFRNEQRKLINEVKNGGMAVCSDVGFKNDVHPTNKKDVGERLARWALNKTYKQNIVPSGPLPLKATYVNGKVIITFQYTAKGLSAYDGGELKGFSLDGMNSAIAVIGDSGIIIPVKEKPGYIYYGWKPYSDGNLINSENLPASTFKIKVK
jgi:sialate O-acetylesterase